MDLEAVPRLENQARSGEQRCLDGPRLELALPQQLARERDRQHVTVREHRRIAARVGAQRDDAIRCGQCEAPRAVRCEDDDLAPGRVRERPFPDAPKDDGRRAVHVGGEEGDSPGLCVPALCPERPFADVAAGVGQPERAAAGGDRAGDAAAGARADEAMARKPLVAAGSDFPETDLVAARAVFVRVGDLGARDAHAGDRPGDRLLARRRRRRGRNERKHEGEGEKQAHRLKLLRTC